MATRETTKAEFTVNALCVVTAPTVETTRTRSWTWRRAGAA